ncbi:hypothetical protein C0J52_24434 [Blattella germanica]|nr:hypothetical protein C0J52_24434 [Blattella germanica]
MPFPPPPPPGPPPPGPPPPPAFGGGSSRPVDGDGRNLLLKSIRQGKTLKKTVTNDRSAPIVGKVSSASSSTNSSPRTNSGFGSSSDVSRVNGPGGLFSGGIPKLKPVGRGYAGNVTPESSSRSSGPENINSKPNLSSSQVRLFN